MQEEKKVEVPLVSVVVPVCNVENYVAQCLESLSAQTLQSIEFLLVDDGSKDSSPQIMAEYAARDPRMRIISKPNGGYGSAVNAGLAQARGTYVGIVEPDDFIEPHMYEDLATSATLADGTLADVVKSSYWEYYDLPDRPTYLKAPNLMNCMPKCAFTGTVQENFEVLFHHPSVWSAIYRREFLTEHGIRMMEVPGGGWVDNPFFFETLLQAKTFVWVPSAYYYYRQTNPTSSSNLKDYHLPFDRLRDLRALFERLNVTDPQVKACLYARHFFYINSVLGEWGYSESDPQIASLIKEAMGALDRDVLYGGYKGIRKEYLTFYESIVGNPAQRIGVHAEATAEPRASVVVPMCNDRDVLGLTLESLCAQTLGSIEVVCVDCACADASVRIAEAFASKDARIRVLHVESTSRAAGLEAGLEAARAPVTAVMLPGQVAPKDYLAQAAELIEGGADLALALKSRPRSYAPFDDDAKEAVLDVPGLEAELALCAYENVSACAFRTSRLREAGVHGREGDEDLIAFTLEAVCAARTAAIKVGEAPAGAGVARMFIPKEGRFENGNLGRYRAIRSQLDTAYEACKDLGEGALRAFRCLAVRRMLDEERSFLSGDDAEEVLAGLREDLQGRWGLLDAPRTSYCNQDAFLALENALSCSYEYTLRREVKRMRGTASSSQSEVSDVRSSTSYKIGNAIVRAGMKILPKSLVRKIQG